MRTFKNKACSMQIMFQIIHNVTRKTSFCLLYPNRFLSITALKSPKLFDAHRLYYYLWSKLGLALKVSYSYHTELSSNSISNSERLEGVLNKWIESESVPVTWERLIEALEEIELKSVVRSIQEFLKTN